MLSKITLALAFVLAVSSIVPASAGPRTCWSDMVQYDREGKPFTVYYQQLTPMMLNELQMAHQHAKEQDTKIARLASEMEQMQRMLPSQSAGSTSRLANSQPTLSGVLFLTICLSGGFLVAVRTRQAR